MRKINRDKKIATKTQATNRIEDTVAETSGEFLEETEDSEAEMAIVIIFIEVEDRTIHTIHSNNHHAHQHQHRRLIKAQNKVQVQKSVVNHLYKLYPQNKFLVTQYAKVVCFKCGYPNHLANQCALGRGKRQRGNFPFQKSRKNF